MTRIPGLLFILIIEQQIARASRITDFLNWADN